MGAVHGMCALALCVSVGAVHAQACSGGAHGGMDATGNQCGSAPDEDVSAAATTSLAAPVAALQPERPAAAQARPVTLPAPRVTAAVLRVPAALPAMPAPGRLFAVLPSVASARSATLVESAVHPCSGGADGGMDATGNQCN